jgi:TFIIF-interacting CTD phosphatase-like protein
VQNYYKKTLILDLDETIIHSQKSKEQYAHGSILVKDPERGSQAVSLIEIYLILLVFYNIQTISTVVSCEHE